MDGQLQGRSRESLVLLTASSNIIGSAPCAVDFLMYVCYLKSWHHFRLVSYLRSTSIILYVNMSSQWTKGPVLWLFEFFCICLHQLAQTSASILSRKNRRVPLVDYRSWSSSARSNLSYSAERIKPSKLIRLTISIQKFQIFGIAKNTIDSELRTEQVLGSDIPLCC